MCRNAVKSRTDVGKQADEYLNREHKLFVLSNAVCSESLRNFQSQFFHPFCAFTGYGLALLLFLGSLPAVLTPEFFLSLLPLLLKTLYYINGTPSMDVTIAEVIMCGGYPSRRMARSFQMSKKRIWGAWQRVRAAGSIWSLSQTRDIDACRVKSHNCKRRTACCGWRPQS